MLAKTLGKTISTIVAMPLLLSSYVFAQQGMGIGNSNPQEMLDVTGAVKIGTDFNNSNAAPTGGAGTIRWNGTNFQGWDGAQWITFASTSANVLQDADTDTKVQVEESPDEDIIRFDVGGSEVFTMRRAGSFPYLETSSNSVLIGSSISNSITGNYNVAIGLNAGGGLTSGQVNTFVGTNAGGMMTDGHWNVMMGNTAGHFMTNGLGNTVIGGAAGRYRTGGNYNVIMGVNAGLNSGAGNSNVMVGPSAGENSTGSNNVFLGLYAGQNEAASNRLYIDNTNTSSPLIYGEFDNNILGINGNLGVGTQSPTYKLHVAGGSIYSADNYYIGNTSGTGTTPLRIDGFENKLYLIAENGVNGSIGGTEIRFRTASTNSTAVDVMTINNNGNVGMGTTTPADELHVVGSIRMVDGNQATGKIMVSNANGTATWTDPTTISVSTDEIIDNDGDTKVQVEESNDEDKIRFDMAGVERFVMNGSHLEVMNSGNSVFIGQGAGTNDDLSNNNNVYIGKNAGNANISGSTNTAVGSSALANSTSSFNTAVGWGTMEATTTGINSTAVGHWALHSNTTGTSNLALGSHSLRDNVSGSHNTSVGVNAGEANTGNANTFLGRYSGRSNTGSGNVFLGAYSGQIETGSNRLYIENSNTSSPLIYGEFDNNIVGINGNLGVGTQSPETKLDVLNGDLQVGRTGNTGGSFIAIRGGKNGGGVPYNGAPANALGRLEFRNTDYGSSATEYTAAAITSENRPGTDDGDLRFYTTSDLVTTEAMNISYDGNVGIGTIADQKLHVIGSIKMVDGNQQAGFVPVSDANGKMTWSDPTTVVGSQAWSLTGNAGTNPNNNFIGTTDSKNLRFLTSNTERMVLTNGGRLGIGTTNPSSTVHVAGITTIGDPTSVSATFLNMVRSGSAGRIYLGSGGSAPHMVINAQTTNGAIVLSTSTGEVMRAKDGGNVGIGTTNPADKLHVVGNIRMVDGNQQTGYIPVSDANGKMTWTDPATISTASDPDWTISGSDQYSAVSGNVGIGSATPNAKLQVQVSQSSGLSLPVLVRNLGAVNGAGTGSGIGFSNYNAGTSAKAAIYNERVSDYGLGKLHFLMNNTSDNTGVSLTTDARMTIISNGNIGIGETSPLSKLHVAGSIRMVDGNQQVGYIPVSDADGKMTWTDPTGISGTVSEVVDADGDTKIQVEETADEDIIRFDLAGTEKWVMTASRLEPSNSGNSVFIGPNAGSNDDLSANANVFIGNNAGRDNTTGSANVAIGASALRSNNSNYNIAIGNALMNSTSAQGTIVLGHNSMANSNGDYNVVLGTQAGTNHTSGTQNIFIGSINVAQANVSGSNNIMMGAGSGQGNTGSQNVFLGIGTGSNNTGSGSVFLGHNAGKNEVSSDRLYIENSISAAPLIYGEFDNDILGINGNLGVGTQAPQDELHVLGSIRMVDGNQQTGYIPVSDANGTMVWTNPTTIATADDGDWTISGNNIHNSNIGNVGIGTTTPASGFHVAKPDGIQLNVAQGGGAIGGIYFRDGYTRANNRHYHVGITTYDHSGGGTGFSDGLVISGYDGLAFTTNNTGTTTLSNVRMFISQSGSVGIGTQSPGDKLHVAGNIRMVDGNQQAGYIPVSDANGTMVWTNPTTITTADDGDWTANGNNIYNGNTGNIGIGTPSPIRKLHVNGDGMIQNGTLTLSSNDSYDKIQLTDAGTSGSKINHSSGWSIDYLAGPGSSGTTGGHRFFTTANGYSEKMRITSNGNVGVGAVNPSYKLDVNGTGRFSDNLYIDNNKNILPTPGGNYARIGWSGNAFQDITTRYSYVSTSFSPSDSTLKKHIMPVAERIDAIQALKSIQPKAFKWNLDKLYWEGAKAVTAADTAWRYGFIAQDIQQVMPETVHQLEESGTLAVNFDAIVSVLFEATRRQQEIIEQEREARIELESQLKSVLNRISQLEGDQ